MSARLIGWIEGSGRLEAELSAVTRVGATPDNEIVVRVEGVSRQHATITSEADGFWLEDARSRNGTWINGERATRSKLRHLDVITLGRFAELVFVAREGAPVAVAGLSVAIEWLNGPAAGERVAIAHGETILGRAESCRIVINDGSISRAHARLTHAGDSVSIEDLGSINGTTVNDQPLSAAVVLEPNAEVEMGDRRFRVLIEGHGARPPAGVPGATPTAAQDVEWMTRLVWSESDLEAVRATAGTAGARRPAVPASRPPAAAARPAASASAAKPPSEAASPAPAAPTIATPQAARTEPGEPSFETPPRVSSEGLAIPVTIIGQPGTFSPPTFAPGSTPALSERTVIGDEPLAIPADVKAPGTLPSAQPRVSDSAPRTAIDRTDLPPSTVLGYRDVAPTVRPGTAIGIEPPPATEAGSMAGVSGVLLQGVRLSGTVGVFELGPGIATVGRSEQATVRIDSRDVSRTHAVLTVREHEVVLEDRGSVNGTTLNGMRVSGSLPLTHRDRVAFADFEFLVEFLRAEAKP